MACLMSTDEVSGWLEGILFVSFVGSLENITLVTEVLVARILQEGSSSSEDILSLVMAKDGSVILTGGTYGYFTMTSGTYTPDAVAVKLDADGNEIWRWQVKRDGWTSGVLLQITISLLPIPKMYHSNLCRLVTEPFVPCVPGKGSRTLDVEGWQ